MYVNENKIMIMIAIMNWNRSLNPNLFLNPDSTWQLISNLRP